MLAHARALLTGTAEGRLAYLDADLAEPERILTSSELRDTLDLTRPVALSLISVVHFLPDSADPYRLVRRYLDELPSGSYLALTHLTADFAPDEIGRMAAVYGQRGVIVNPRHRAAVERFFDGLELVEPGVQAVSRWRPQDADDEVTDAKVNMYGGLARKPSLSGLRLGVCCIHRRQPLPTENLLTKRPADGLRGRSRASCRQAERSSERKICGQDRLSSPDATARRSVVGLTLHGSARQDRPSESLDYRRVTGRWRREVRPAPAAGTACREALP